MFAAAVASVLAPRQSGQSPVRNHGGRNTALSVSMAEIPFVYSAREIFSDKPSKRDADLERFKARYGPFQRYIP